MRKYLSNKKVENCNEKIFIQFSTKIRRYIKHRQNGRRHREEQNCEKDNESSMTNVQTTQKCCAKFNSRVCSIVVGK